MRKFTSLCLILFFLSCAPARISKETPHAASTRRTLPYLVKKGDSLWRISRKYGVSVEALMRANKIRFPSSLKVGQRIAIPQRYRKTAGSFSWPVEGNVVNFFGETVDNSFNKGINIKVNSRDRQVRASREGHVVFANDLKGRGETVIVKHAADIYTIYANLDSVSVKEGLVTKEKQIIGKVASGRNGNYILHFEIRKRHIPHDPLRYIN